MVALSRNKDWFTIIKVMNIKFDVYSTFTDILKYINYLKLSNM